MIKHSFSDFSYAVNTTSEKQGFKEVLVCFMYNGTEVIRKVYIKEGAGVSYVFEAKKVIDKEMRDGTLSDYAHKFVLKNKRKAELANKAKIVYVNKPNKKWAFVTGGIATAAVVGATLTTYFVTKAASKNSFNVYFISNDCETTSQLKSNKGEKFSCDVELKDPSEIENKKPSISQIYMGNHKLNDDEYYYDYREQKLTLNKPTNDTIIIVAKGITAEEVVATGIPSIDEETNKVQIADIEIPYGFDKSQVTKVEIPSKVTINNETRDVEEIKQGLLAGYGSLTDLTIPFVGLNKNNVTYGNEQTEHATEIFGAIFGDKSYTDGISTWQEWKEGDSRKMKEWFIPYDLSDVVVTDAKSIPVGAFSECNRINDIVIQSSEKTINVGDYAFYQCTALETVTHDAVAFNKIGDYSFQECKSLINFDFTDTKSVGKHGFYNCSGTINLTIPESVIEVGSEAFVGVGGVINVIAESQPKDWAKDWVGSTTAVIYGGEPSTHEATDSDFEFTIASSGDEKVAYLSRYTGSQYTDGVEIPNTVRDSDGQDYKVKYLGFGLFYQYTTIKKVTFKCLDLETIGNYCFAGCTGLETIVFPHGEGDITLDSYKLTTLGSGAFQGCSELKINDTITSTITDLNNSTFPTSLANIGDKAFYKCSDIENISVPHAEKVGESAFEECIRLKDVKVYGDSESFGRRAFYNSEILEHVYWYLEESKLTDPKIGNKFTTVSEECFKNTSIGGTNSEVPYYVSTIEVGAYENTKITELKLPDLSQEGYLSHLTSIESNALKNCKNLTSVTNLNLNYSLTSLGSGIFEGCEKLTILDFSKATGLTVIPDNLCMGCVNLNTFKIGTTDVTTYNSYIGSGITKIGDNAFNSCGSLGYIGSNLDTTKALFVCSWDLNSFGNNVFAGWSTQFNSNKYISGGQQIFLNSNTFNTSTETTKWGWKLDKTNVSSYWGLISETYYTPTIAQAGTKTLAFKVA